MLLLLLFLSRCFILPPNSSISILISLLFTFRRSKPQFFQGSLVNYSAPSINNTCLSCSFFWDWFHSILPTPSLIHAVESWRCRRIPVSSKIACQYMQLAHAARHSAKFFQTERTICFGTFCWGDIRRELIPTNVYNINFREGSIVKPISNRISITLDLWTVSYTHLTLPTKRIV